MESEKKEHNQSDNLAAERVGWGESWQKMTPGWLDSILS